MKIVLNIDQIKNTFLIFVFIKIIHFVLSQKQYCPSLVLAPPQEDAVNNSEHLVNETHVPQFALHP